MQALLRNSIGRLCKRIESELGLHFGGTPSTQNYGDEADEGTGTAIALSNHIHGMPGAPDDPIDQFDEFIFLYTDMIYNVAAASFPDLKTSSAGAGAGVVIGGREGIGEKFAFGSIDVRTSSGAATAFSSAVFTDRQETFDSRNQDLYTGRMRRVETRVRPFLDTTERPNLRFVFGGVRTSGAASGLLNSITDGVYFYLETDASGVGNWTANCTASSITTTVDLGVEPRLDGTESLFEVLRITLDLGTAVFYLNDAVVATITTNIPGTSSSNFLSGWGAILQNKTASVRRFVMDYLLFKGDRIAS